MQLLYILTHEIAHLDFNDLKIWDTLMDDF